MHSADSAVHWFADMKNLGPEWQHFRFEERVDKSAGEVGIAIALNEMLEPLRVPFCLLTLKPVSKFIGMAPKYDFMDEQKGG